MTQQKRKSYQAIVTGTHGYSVGGGVPKVRSSRFERYSDAWNWAIAVTENLGHFNWTLEVMPSQERPEITAQDMDGDNVTLEPTLTREQILQQDFVDNEIWDMLKTLCPSGGDDTDTITWDINVISQIRDIAIDYFVRKLGWGDSDVNEFYPSEGQ